MHLCLLCQKVFSVTFWLTLITFFLSHYSLKRYPIFLRLLFNLPEESLKKMSTNNNVSSSSRRHLFLLLLVRSPLSFFFLSSSSLFSCVQYVSDNDGGLNIGSMVVVLAAVFVHETWWQVEATDNSNWWIEFIHLKKYTNKYT